MILLQQLCHFMPLKGEEDAISLCFPLPPEGKPEKSQESFMSMAAFQRSLLAMKWLLFSIYFSKLLYVFSCRLRVCSVPGCFLQDLSNPDSHYVTYFKKNKEELAWKLYCLYNSTIFDQKVDFKTTPTILKC